ncbi:MAG: hypothetical protein RLZZ352_1853 [Pseudomonadota bacterium]
MGFDGQLHAQDVLPGWQAVIQAFLISPSGRQLQAFLHQRLAQGAVIYPPQPLRALALTEPASVRVVILGQDPYHGPGQAEGLAFSVAPGMKIPPSLRNIFKELNRDLNRPMPPHGSLSHWAEQGVLLLNTCLTVDAGQAGSHFDQGWEIFTDTLIAQMNHGAPKAFLLWGSQAQKKAVLLNPAKHLVLTCKHPSPLSARRGAQAFLGCGHFGQVNQWLTEQGFNRIEW